MNQAKVLVVEDDRSLAKSISEVLQNAYDWPIEVKCIYRGDEALSVVARWQPDVILLDLGLPGLHGYAVLKQVVHEFPRCKLCIISSTTSLEDRVFGFREGTDDFLVKPFSLIELVARVHALLRRSKIINERNLVYGDLCLSYEGRCLVRNGVRIMLTKREYDLLRYLMERPSDVISRDELLDTVWEGKERYPNVVDAHIESLRKKIDRPFSERIIFTAYRFGYFFELPKQSHSLESAEAS